MKYISIFFVFCLLLFGCSVESEAPPLLVSEVKEVEEKEKRFIDPKVLDQIVARIQEEMQVFDVVEHHDTLYAAIVEEMKEQELDNLNAVVEEIVKKHMDHFLRERIDDMILLYDISPSLSEREWIFQHIKTGDLYRLMTLYEVAFFKREKGVNK